MGFDFYKRASSVEILLYLPLEKLTANFNLNSIKIESPISLHQVGICSCFVAFKSTEKKLVTIPSYMRAEEVRLVYDLTFSREL